MDALPPDDPFQEPLDMSVEGILARADGSHRYEFALAEWRQALADSDFDVSSKAVQDIIEASFAEGFAAGVRAREAGQR